MNTPGFLDFWTLRFAAKGGPLTQLLSQRIGAACAYMACRLGLTPSQVTLLGGLVFMFSAWLYSCLPSGIGSALICALLFQFAFGLDCADGQLARGTGKTSFFGAWLDIATDYVRNVVIAFALMLWMVETGTLALVPAAVICMLLLSGSAVLLHTTVAQRQIKEKAELPVAGRLAIPRRIFTWMIDTPSYLLFLCLLRDAGLLLPLYLAGMGSVQLFTAIFLARNRLPGPQ